MGVMACTCCQGCIIGSDTFTEPDNALVPGWSQISGSSAIASNALEITASGTLVIFQAVPVAGTVEVNARVDLVAASNGAVIRLHVKEKDTMLTDSYFAELTIGASGTLKVFKRVAGTETQLATIACATSAGTKYTLLVCYGNGALLAKELVTDTNRVAVIATTVSTQHNAGIQVVTASSSVRFTNFEYQYSFNASTKPGCFPCSCTPTVSDGCCMEFAANVDITLPNIWPTTGGNCNPFCTFGGHTFTLQNNRSQASRGSTTLNCTADKGTWVYEHDISGTGCWLQIVLFALCDVSNHCQWTCFIGRSLNSSVWSYDQFQVTFVFIQDCAGDMSLSIAWNGHVNSGGITVPCVSTSTGPVVVTNH